MARHRQLAHRLDALERGRIIVLDDPAEQGPDLLGRGPQAVRPLWAHAPPALPCRENLRRKAVFVGAQAFRTDR